MKTSARLLFLTWIAALVPLCASADDKPAIEVLSEITLDIDHDGKMDRAVMVHEAQSIYAGLYIYLADTPGPLDLSRRPSFTKKDLTTDPVIGLATNDKGSLIVKYGRGGSNQYETRLTIISRKGEFLVAGFASEWDTRASIGSCDLNFLTGKGLASTGTGKGKPVKVKFAPVKLSAWSEDRKPKACG